MCPNPKQAPITPLIPIFVPFPEWVSLQVPLRTKISFTQNHLGWQFHLSLSETSIFETQKHLARCLYTNFLPIPFRNLPFVLHIGHYRPKMVFYFLPAHPISAAHSKYVPQCNKLSPDPKYRPQFHSQGHFVSYPIYKHGPSVELLQIRHKTSVCWVTSIVFVSVHSDTKWHLVDRPLTSIPPLFFFFSLSAVL